MTYDLKILYNRYLLTNGLNYKFITKLKANAKVELFKYHTKRRVTKNNQVT